MGKHADQMEFPGELVKLMTENGSTFLKYLPEFMTRGIPNDWFNQYPNT